VSFGLLTFFVAPLAIFACNPISPKMPACGIIDAKENPIEQLDGIYELQAIQSKTASCRSLAASW
tara:strand:+ start:380 stop:574 length:195 start_codon:yes stop_codon:yes gene_type:complete